MFQLYKDGDIPLVSTRLMMERKEKTEEPKFLEEKKKIRSNEAMAIRSLLPDIVGTETP